MLSPALPFKDALRGLRTGLATGRRMIRPLEDHSPKALAGLMRGVLSRADTVGLEVDRTTSRLVHMLLDRPESRDFRGWTMARMAVEPAGPAIFAERLYCGLDVAFERLGLPSELLSEARAARAFEHARHSAPEPEDVYDLSAELLLRADECMFAPPPPFGARTPTAERHLALFAVMLWLLAEPARDQEEEEALLGVCIDAASALGRQVADLPDDRQAIRQLLRDYARLI